MLVLLIHVMPGSARAPMLTSRYCAVLSNAESMFVPGARVGIDMFVRAGEDEDVEGEVGERAVSSMIDRTITEHASARSYPTYCTKLSIIYSNGYCKIVPRMALYCM